MSQPKDWLDKLFTRTTPNNKDLQAHYGWQQGDTAYEWYGNGMLKSVRTPEGATIRFEYDALGRRTLKEFRGIRYRYAWDGNVLLHEWNYHSWTKPIRKKDKYGRYSYSSPEPLTNVTTWVYDGQSHTPVAKFTEEDCYSIVQDHLGTPTQAFDSRGNKVWDCVLDIYGDIQMIEGDRDFIPFRFQGQYADVETGLYYNRFRYYSPEFGNYISQDPIRMAGNNPTLYGYVKDTNSWLDPFGLDCWSTARKKYWKREALINPHKYSARNIARMKEGKAPMMRVVISKLDVGFEAKDISMELHHWALPQRLKTPKANELWNLIPATPWGHASMDSHRYINNELYRIIRSVKTW